ncbi:FtsK/SpoIIIE domain-containing protein [Bacillus weihaiensis]|uniref:FtsK/SpoIIIE domain-containing protein n=1 Tax=Bacillus weihaiensis TaxID=1547283 RepID=UPI00235568F4|nr:FtsK/SpoIIIE domain-containing protein [Bacillus weihaiensis]
MLISFFSPFLLAAGALWLGRRNWSDQDKIQKILEVLEVREGDKVRKFKLLRKDFINDDKSLGVEYVYKIPLKVSMDDIERLYPKLRDGINVKREGKQKHVEIEYDGALKIKVYENPVPDKVEYNRELIQLCKKWQVPLGDTFEGSVFHDFDSIPHMLVAGTTRYGKTVYLKNLITTLTVNHPEEVIFSLIDLKGMLAFARFENLRQVKYTASNAYEAMEVLTHVVTEMNTRMSKFRGRYEDVKEANISQRHFIIVDEGAQLSSKQTKDKNLRKVLAECERLMEEVARLGAGLGFRLIYATQYPLRENLPPNIKMNCDAKLVFRLQNDIASRVVMNQDGAEKLPRKKGAYQGGRAIYMTDAPLLVQTPFITNETIEELIEPYKVVKNDEYNRKKQPEERTDFVEFGNLRIPVNKSDAKNT